MRALKFLGPQDSVSAGGVVFPCGVVTCVTDPWWEAHRALLSPVQFEDREATVNDVRPQHITYSDDRYTGSITAVIVNFRTPGLIRDAVISLKMVYPDLALTAVDNGSGDGASVDVICELAERFAAITPVFLPHNEGHGPPMHRAMMEAKTDLAFTMDSDVIVRRGGFLERMETRLREAGLYAIGPIWWRDWYNDNHYLSPVAGLYDLAVYRTLPPFEHAPDIAQTNMREAQRRGLKVEDFPIFDYLWHIEQGTRGRYGSAWDLTGVA